MDGVLKSPADAVTTRYLQTARRSAQRKAKPRQDKLASESSGKKATTQKGMRKDLEIIPTNPRLCTPSFDTVRLLCRLASEMGWTLNELNRGWSFGYNTEHIANIIRNLPPDVLDCIKQASAYCRRNFWTKNESAGNRWIDRVGWKKCQYVCFSMLCRSERRIKLSTSSRLQHYHRSNRARHDL
jgi:hypothetical protein